MSVADEVLAGDALSLSQAAAILPGFRGNQTVDPATVWRWVTTGSKNQSGALVKLEAARLGVRWLTSKAALARFMEACTASCDPATPQSRTPRERKKSHDAARARLVAAGVLRL